MAHLDYHTANLVDHRDLGGRRITLNQPVDTAGIIRLDSSIMDGRFLLYALLRLCVLQASWHRWKPLTRLYIFLLNKLMCWTLPTVGFAGFAITPSIEVPSPGPCGVAMFISTAWMTDYIIRTEESEDADL